MPLLCISLLALLLLPLSLSCDSKRPLKEVRDDWLFVETHLNDADGIIATVLQNTSCPALKHKLRNCTPDNADVVSPLHFLTCKMKTLSIPHTDGLVRAVLGSLRCPCSEKPTKEPNVRLKRRRATRQRRNEQKQCKKETKKLCKAKAILSAVTTCYQMLNTITMDT
uniref:Interleukin-7 n=1 Tax=Sander lucioperca TaxID=283035 RepID=A0A8C9XXX3_SANLU